MPGNQSNAFEEDRKVTDDQQPDIETKGFNEKGSRNAPNNELKVDSADHKGRLRDSGEEWWQQMAGKAREDWGGYKGY